MPAFGLYNIFPRRFGGGRSIREQESIALKRAFERDGFDPEHPTKAAEAHALSIVPSIIWACNERLRGAEIPARMIETLPTYEELTRVVVDPNSSDTERRTNVEAKLRGTAGQSTADDIEAVARVLFGASYQGIYRVSEASALTYWIKNPGPPGKEWSSTRCYVGIAYDRKVYDDALWNRILARARDMFSTLIPAWEVWFLGHNNGTGFLPDVSLPDVDFVGPI